MAAIRFDRTSLGVFIVGRVEWLHESSNVHTVRRNRGAEEGVRSHALTETRQVSRENGAFNHITNTEVSPVQFRWPVTLISIEHCDNTMLQSPKSIEHVILPKKCSTCSYNFVTSTYNKLSMYHSALSILKIKSFIRFFSDFPKDSTSRSKGNISLGNFLVTWLPLSMKFEIPSREGKRRVVTRDAYEVTARSSRKCTAGYVGFMLDKAVHVSIRENVSHRF